MSLSGGVGGGVGLVEGLMLVLRDIHYQGRTQDFRKGGGGGEIRQQTNKPNKRATELKPCAHQGAMFTSIPPGYTPEYRGLHVVSH